MRKRNVPMNSDDLYSMQYMSLISSSKHTADYGAFHLIKTNNNYNITQRAPQFCGQIM
jgi:hypothetical protein